MVEALFEKYYNAISIVDKQKAFGIIDDALEQGLEAEEIVFKMVVPGIEKMLESFLYKKEVALSRHFLATTMANEIVDKLIPLFKRKAGESGTIVLGSASGDFHGLGRKIVGGCLRANMFEVVDLGLNVPAERFVDKAVETGAGIIGISSMMVHTALSEEGPKKVRRLLRERDLEQSIKLVVGGAPYLFDSELYRKVDADSWAENGIRSVSVIEHLIRDLKK